MGGTARKNVGSNSSSATSSTPRKGATARIASTNTAARNAVPLNTESLTTASHTRESKGPAPETIRRPLQEGAKSAACRVGAESPSTAILLPPTNPKLQGDRSTAPALVTRLPDGSVDEFAEQKKVKEMLQQVPKVQGEGHRLRACDLRFSFEPVSHVEHPQVPLALYQSP